MDGLHCPFTSTPNPYAFFQLRTPSLWRKGRHRMMPPHPLMPWLPPVPAPLPLSLHLIPTWLPLRSTSWGLKSDRWLFLRPGYTYPLIPGDPDRKWIAGQVTPSGGPSCPHVASQEGRMRSVVLRHRSLAPPPQPDERNQIIGSRLVSPCAYFFILFLSPLFPIFFSLVSAPTLAQFDIISSFFHRLLRAHVRSQ